MGKKGYGSCFGYNYQQYTKYIIKYVERHFNTRNINCQCRKEYKLQWYNFLLKIVMMTFKKYKKNFSKSFIIIEYEK